MATARPFTGEVYLHWNPISEKGYVGQTSRSTSMRWSEHVKHSHSPRCLNFNYPLARAIRKYSPEAFEHQTLSLAGSKTELDNLERVWIILLQTRNLGYNVTAGGDGNLGLKHTPDTLAKMSEAKLGNKHCLGRQASIETRAKLSAGNKGKKRGPYPPERLAGMRSARWPKFAEGV